MPKKTSDKNKKISWKQPLNKAQIICHDITHFVISSTPDELREINCEMIARKYGISPGYLSRTFRATKGMSLREVIKRIKLLRCVLSMYENPDLPVEQIAEKSGFLDIEYFRKSFKSIFGTTPRRFMKCE
jgi:AraC-like DNA-binding protein